MGLSDRPHEPGRVALVHDFLLDVRGAERVFLELCEMWPQADIYTAIYDKRGTEGRFARRRVHTSFLQLLRPTARNFRALLPLYPAAIESLDLSGYDLVISSSSAWAHGVRPDPTAVHVCYCYNPFRYAWNELAPTLSHRTPPVRAVLRPVLNRWRNWDREVAKRVDRYIAISEITRQRVREYYLRDAHVVYPPVDLSRFAPAAVADHYVTVSELVPHKQIDVAIEAFNQLQLPLVVVGDGPAARRLHRLAGPTIRFTGRVSDVEVARLVASARAMIVTAVEEFGIAIVESQAAGRPVIARRAGGALETIDEGVTGCLWSGNPTELADAVLRFDDGAIDPQACVENAARFGTDAFRESFYAELEAALAHRALPSASSPRTAAVAAGG